jgi:uncharacterized repeat protein (TIGR03803 family)
MRLKSVVWLFVVLLGPLGLWAGGARAHGYQIEYLFKGDSDGSLPMARLIDVAGKLYGTTREGGCTYACCARGCGTIYAFDPATGVETVLYAFTGGADGSQPFAGLTKVGAKLYGTAQLGGSGWGVLFSLDPTTNTETVLYTFKGGADAGYPVSDLVYLDGKLYGVSQGGGGTTCQGIGCGTIFSFDLASGAEGVVYAFKGSPDVLATYGDLLYFNGKLYGSGQGGATGHGAVFSVDPASGAEAVIYSFAGGADGEYPGNLSALAGKLYGTTGVGGGASACVPGCGTVFSLDPATGVETKLYMFQGAADGEYPGPGLLEFNGEFYGVANAAGAAGSGTVFSFDPSANALMVLHAFRGGHDGAGPYAPLMMVSKRLYGSTELAGRKGCQSCGTLFSLNP